MSGGDEGFLSRWSRRKVQVKSGAVLPPEPELAPSEPAPLAAPLQTEPPSPAAEAPQPQQEPLPTLDDVAKLTRDSDYTAFVRPGVEPGVRNAAMKKLFADPHYNIMDGLDVYIDDYGKPDPLPLSMLRQMVQAKALGLFDDEDKDDQAKPGPAAPPEASTDGAADAAAPLLTAPAHEDPDLQLQPDDAARRESAGGRADAQPGRDDTVG